MKSGYKTVICPYCERSQGDSESFKLPDGIIAEQTCFNCNKIFKYTTNYNINFSSFSLCEEHYGGHRFKEIVDGWWNFIGYQCEQCGEWKNEHVKEIENN